MDPNVHRFGYYQPQPMQPMQPMQPVQSAPSVQQQQTTVVIQQQPQTVSVPQNTREWQHGIYGCCADLGECMSPQLIRLS